MNAIEVCGILLKYGSLVIGDNDAKQRRWKRGAASVQRNCARIWVQIADHFTSRR